MRFFFACAILLSAVVAWGEAEKGEKAEREEETNGKAAERAKALKTDVANFVLDLRYVGETDKPYYSLILSASKLLGAADDRFNSAVQIDKAQAEKTVDCLAADGFLAAARDVKRADVAWTGPCYVLTVSGADMELALDLGWDLAMVERLDGLRKVLDGDAAKAMDKLIARLSGERKAWQAALKEKFDAAYAQWHRECETIKESSKTGDYIGLPAFKSMAAMGRPALPYLQAKMEQTEGLDFMLAFAAVEIEGWNKADFRGGSEQDFCTKVLAKLKRAKETN